MQAAGTEPLWILSTILCTLPPLGFVTVILPDDVTCSIETSDDVTVSGVASAVLGPCGDIPVRCIATTTGVGAAAPDATVGLLNPLQSLREPETTRGAVKPALIVPRTVDTHSSHSGRRGDW